MNRRNYQRELDRILEMITRESRVPRLFLHACCAPCSSYVLEYLSDYFCITLFYYNPNISPKEEFERRVEELKRLLEAMPAKNPVELVIGPYEPEKFLAVSRGLEDEKEGGARCEACYRLRMEEAARLAAAGGYDYFTTTLTISPKKDAVKLNAIGEELSHIYAVRHLPSEFKKKGGFDRSVALSAEYGLYRQNYCGCVFSRQEAAV